MGLYTSVTKNIQDDLFNAIKNNKIDEVKLLIDNTSANIDIKNKDGETPLLVASFNNNKEIPDNFTIYIPYLFL